LTEEEHDLRAFWDLVKGHRNVWLVPLLVLLALAVGLIVLGGDSLLTPFHYSVF
jgi:Family of unknown function (DUF5989)